MNLSPEEKERFDNLSTSDQLKLEKIFSMMKDEKDKANEIFTTDGGSEDSVDKLAGIGENGDVDDYAEEISEEMDDSVKDLLDKISNHLKGSDRNFQDGEIKMYIDSLKRDIKRGEIDDVKSASMEDHEEDLENYIADRALQEHFGRFLKDYQ